MAKRFHRRRGVARTMPTRKQQTKIPLESLRRKKPTTNQWRKRISALMLKYRRLQNEGHKRSEGQEVRLRPTKLAEALALRSEHRIGKFRKDLLVKLQSSYTKFGILTKLSRGPTTKSAAPHVPVSWILLKLPSTSTGSKGIKPAP
jgi:hypothetical protein